ncbi:MAG TPA: D-alanine--D-alanine ligase [Isosphaeraceae bacterium]
MSAHRPRVAVLFDPPALPPGHPDAASEAGGQVARAVAGALKAARFKAFPMAAKPPAARLVRRLARQGPDVVFNLVEGFGGRTRGAAHVAGLLELLGLPYTGCPPEALGLCVQKGRTKALLLGSGLPTAPFAVVGPGEPWAGAGPGPVIVKPDAEDASLGIDQGSIVADPGAIEARVARVRAAYGPRVLVEAYLPGAEFQVGVLAMPEPEPLPVAEVVFNPPAGSWPILTFAAKWAAGSAEDLASPVRCPAQVEPGLADRLGRLAVAAFRATGCRDYARVDFRLDAAGAPMILEVNPNPDISPEAGWARALRASGRDYVATIAALARRALERGTGHD